MIVREPRRLGLVSAHLDEDGEPPDAETVALAAAGERAFDAVVRLHPHRLLYALDRGAARSGIADLEGRPLPRLAAAVFRGVRRAERGAAVLARCLELAGCRLVDPASRFTARGGSKALGAVERFAAGVGVDAWIAFDPRGARALLDDLWRRGAAPLVAKPDDGSGGCGVARLDARAEAEHYLERFFASRIEPDVPLLLERWVRFAAEYRVITVEGELLGVAEKLPPAGAVVANARRGARFRAAQAPDVEAFVRRQAAPRGVLGLDVGRGADGELYLLEANPAPLWAEFERATGVDVAAAVVRAAR